MSNPPWQAPSPWAEETARLPRERVPGPRAHFDDAETRLLRRAPLPAFEPSPPLDFDLPPPVRMPSKVALRPMWVVTLVVLLAAGYRVLPHAVEHFQIVETALDAR